MPLNHRGKLLRLASVALTLGAGTVGLTACGGSSNSNGGSSGGRGGSLVTRATTGRQIFLTAGCAKCHTLKAAGTTGHIGPNLDSLKPSAGAVRFQVEHGGGAMPSFAGKLTGAQINAVANFVASAAGH